MPIDADKFLIGRHDHSNLQLKSRTISRRHCAIAKVQGDFVVVDLGGRNPTILNGKQLERGKPTRLSHRDKLQVGRVKMRFLNPDAVPADSDALSPGEARVSMSVSKTPWHDIDKQVPPVSAGNRGNESLATSVLSELEELVSTFDDKGWTTLNQQPVVPDQKGHGEAVEFETLEYTTGEVNTVGEDEGKKLEDSGQPQAEQQSEKPPTKPESKQAIEKKSKEEEEQDQEEGPGKIPEHLRPKSPVSSQSAAEIALKNLFGPRQ